MSATMESDRKIKMSETEATFIYRLEKVAGDANSSISDLVTLVYSPENPIMDLSAIPGRASVTHDNRAILQTMKDGCTRKLSIVPMVRHAFRRELSLFMDWYNEDRPHMSLEGATPNETYYKRKPANRSPRFEPRAAWPRGSPCAAPQTLVKGRPGARIEIEVSFAAGRRHLPRVALILAA